MHFTGAYASPLGDILLAADDAGLIGLWFVGQKHFARTLDPVHIERETPALGEARSWLDAYFSGAEPARVPPLHLMGTPYQLSVWRELLLIPYGQTVTYGELAERIARRRGGARTSPRAVGGAVGRNPVSIIVPCHRVVGTGGSLTGYAGGTGRKKALLEIERALR